MSSAAAFHDGGVLALAAYSALILVTFNKGITVYNYIILPKYQFEKSIHFQCSWSGYSISNKADILCLHHGEGVPGPGQAEPPHLHPGEGGRVKPEDSV